MNTVTSLKCAQCGSPLVLLDSVTEKLEGSLFPQTTSTYRCTNSECQERTDKEMEKRKSQRKEKEEADKRRLEERKKKREDDLMEKGYPQLHETH